MSFRAWLSLITIVLLALVLFASRHELVLAWHLLSRVDIWLLLLLVPGQILVYYAGGEMIFSYLRKKGTIKHVGRWTQVRIALEGNFVNHLLPSGGVSGVSYLTWRLSLLGIAPGRAAMSQVVRYVATFGAYAAILLFALIAVTIDGTINRWIILTSAALLGTIVVLLIAAIFLLSSKRRIDRFGVWAHGAINTLVRKVTFGRRQQVVSLGDIERFLDDMHRDFVELRQSKHLLTRPFIWGIVFNLADVALFMISFWALGESFNPAPVFIAYGVAAFAGFFVLTPGGAGAYEAIMVTFLAFAGIQPGVAIAGVLLTRVILLIGTVIFGYAFYQHTISTYGKNSGAKGVTE
jgi:uncharacterized protein (TIRG00374 family)